MSDATYIACPRCGEPYAMTLMQKQLYHGRTLACQRCAKPFMVTEETPDPVGAPAMRPWAETLTPPPPSDLAASRALAPGSDEPSGSPDVESTARARAPRKRGPGMTPGRMALLILGVCTVLVLGAYVALLPSINRAREMSRRAACAGNLQQIGMALQIYANRSSGRFPDTLDPLVLDGSLPVQVLVCPSSNDTIAAGSTVAEQLADLAKGGHLSYLYIGRGLSITGIRQPVAYEPLHHHHGAGVHVLYSDGTVQFLPASVALTAFPQLAAPTTGPVGAPQTAPAAE